MRLSLSLLGQELVVLELSRGPDPELDDDPAEAVALADLSELATDSTPFGFGPTRLPAEDGE